MTKYLLAAWAVLTFALGARILVLQAEVTGMQRDAATQRASAEAAARRYETALAQREREHAGAQQRQENEYAKEREVLVRQRDAEHGAAVRLRDKLTAATRDWSVGTAGTTADQCGGNRLAELGQLAGEGIDLVAEARSLLRERDSQVTRLLAQIKIDRGACSAAGEAATASTEPVF